MTSKQLAEAIFAMMGTDDDTRPQEVEADEDWKRFDTTDYEALADYYDELAIELGGGVI